PTRRSSDLRERAVEQVAARAAERHDRLALQPSAQFRAGAHEPAAADDCAARVHEWRFQRDRAAARLLEYARSRHRAVERAVERLIEHHARVVDDNALKARGGGAERAAGDERAARSEERRVGEEYQARRTRVAETKNKET